MSTDGGWADAAEGIAGGLMDAARRFAQAVEGALSATDMEPVEEPAVRSAVYDETLALLLHVADRFAYDRMPAQRAELMHAVLASVGQVQAMQARDPAAFRERFNERQREMSAWPALLPREGASPAGSVSWEWAKATASRFAAEEPARITALTVVATDCVVFIARVFAALGL
jgi:hypothetical protein